jgi:hypothetical protein
LGEGVDEGGYGFVKSYETERDREREREREKKVNE